MRVTEVESALKNKLPSIVKNPRKLKKAWKKLMLSKLRSNGLRRGGWKFHWVPMAGWTLEFKRVKV